MNARFHKVIFSKRLGTLVAVGEHASAQGKSASGEGTRGAVLAAAVFLAGLTSAYALDPSALPSGPTAVAGAAAIAVNGPRMDITQSTDRAAINWQSFNIGTGASVHIAQPSATSVLLNRVVGNEMSQIRGQISANGQVVLVNPNGIVMGPTGRITASAFTASSFGISDTDFQAGHMRFERSAHSGAVVNQGSIESTDAGGYVALIGADVNNQSTITTRQGAVVLAAAAAVVMPNTPGFDTQKVSVPLSRNVRLELNPESFGSANVSNSGVIVTDGGQVLMRAAAVVDAVSKIANATVVQSGSIDTSGDQAGRVDILADDGRIRVSGSVTANSAPPPHWPTTGAGTDIYIGRDELTNVLAAVGDVRGAELESLGGFVETSGQYLATHGVTVKAKDWLLDPNDIRIVATDTATSDARVVTSGGTTTVQDNTGILASEVLKSTIESAINAGTNVTISTANPTAGAEGAGNITLDTALSFNNTGAQAATLRLFAVNGITQNVGATITATGSQLVHIDMAAEGRYMGNPWASTSSLGITLNSAITTNGDITLNGRVMTGTAYAVNITGAGTALTVADGRSINIIANTVNLSNSATLNAGTGTVNIKTHTVSNEILLGGIDVQTDTFSTQKLGISNSELNLITAGNVVIGDLASTGLISVTGPTTTLARTGNIALRTGGTISVGAALTSGANLSLQTNGGNIGNTAAISGVNVSIDNTNGSINSTTGVITVGSANSGSAVGISVGSSITATGNLNMWGTSTNNTGINVLANSALRGGNIQATGRVNNGGYGLLLNAGSSVITTGTSGDSLIRGINTNGGSNAVLTGGSPTLTAATGTTLTLWGDGTNTGDRAMRVDGGATTNGSVTIKGTSNNATALILINGLITANANSALTLEGTTANAGQHGVLTINSGGVALNNGASVSILGQNTHVSGTAAGVMLMGSGIGKVAGATSTGQVSITGTAASTTTNTGASVQAGVTTDGNITIVGSVGSAAGTGVSIVGAVSSSGTGTSINVSSNHGLFHTGSLNIAGANGTGGNILITSTLGGLAGTGTIGTTTLKNTSVTVTQAGTSTFSGAINATNFTKAGAGTLTLDSWIAATPANTNISNAYTVSGGTLSLSPHGNYAAIQPASVNVVNNATFSLSNSGNGFWRNTAFNFTGGQGGGTMNLLGNPIGALNTTNTFSTSGGATNTINGLLNANSANVNLTLAAATSGNTLLDGSFAALVFAQNFQGGFGLDNATTITTNGPGGLLFLNKVKANQLNINSGTVQFGNGNAATLAATPELLATNVAIASGAHLILNRAEAQTNTSVFTGTGNLTQAGAGVLTLTGNSSGFAGSTTVNAGRTLAIGTNGNLGAAGSTLSLASASSSVGFTNTAGTSTIGSTISGAGTLSKSGAGTGVLTANNSYTGATSVSGGTLQVGNGGATGTLGAAAVTLSNNATLHHSRSAATTLFNTISGTGNLSAAITGASSDLSVTGSVNLTGGTINLSTDANLTLSQSLTTSNTTASAIVLNAGAATNAGTSTGGDISFSGSGSVNVGAGGRATLYTGSLSGSTGLGVTVGNNRYNSDEQTSNYTAALGSGQYAIYREAPTLNVRFNDTSKTYDAQTFTGGNGLSVVSGLVQGDTSTTFSGINYSGTAQNATNAGTYAISGTALNSQGYTLSYTNGSLTIDKANLVLSGSRDYDATTTFAGQYLTATGVAGQTFTVTGSGHSSNLSSKHVAYNQNVALSTVTGLSLGTSSNGGLAANYHALSTTGSNISITRIAASVTASNTTLTYNGSPHTQAASSSGFLVGDSITVVGLASGTNAATYTSALSLSGADANNYNVTFTQGTLTINRRDISLQTLVASDKVFDGTTSATITGATFSNLVNGETLGLSGGGTFADSAIGNNKTVTVAEVANLTQTNGTGGGRWQNYNLTTSGSFTTLASIRAAAPNPGPSPDRQDAQPDWPKVERLNRRPSDHLLAQPQNSPSFALAQENPDANVITVRGCGAGPAPEWRDSCLDIAPTHTARYN